MTAAMVIAGVVVLAGIVFVARGRGGELSAEHGDYVPLDLGPVSATDVVLLRPPASMWGYDMRATDEAMGRIAESIKERDVRIVALEQLVADLGGDAAPQSLGTPYPAARHRRTLPDADGTDQAPRSDATGEPGADSGWPGGGGVVPPERSHD